MNRCEIEWKTKTHQPILQIIVLKHTTTTIKLSQDLHIEINL